VTGGGASFSPFACFVQLSLLVAISILERFPYTRQTSSNDPPYKDLKNGVNTVCGTTMNHIMLLIDDLAPLREQRDFFRQEFAKEHKCF
jgi:hypothetical protein